MLNWTSVNLNNNVQFHYIRSIVVALRVHTLQKSREVYYKGETVVVAAVKCILVIYKRNLKALCFVCSPQFYTLASEAAALAM